ncbi:MAG: hypothetical protein KDA21_08285 [Phycisphaerales bacterium]|nr:hypothetical protein [Phycisphaerales bacterium]
MAALLTGAAAASADVDLSDGGYSFTWSPGSAGDSLLGDASAELTGPSGRDDLYELDWAYRLPGQSFTTGLVDPVSEQSNGNSGSASFSQDGLDFMVNYTLTDTSAGGNHSATLTNALTISNSGTAPVVLTLFAYLDADLNDSSGNDSATYAASATESAMTIVDHLPNSQAQAMWIADLADVFEIDEFSDLRNNLTDTPGYTLSNSGSPFPGGGEVSDDFTGAYQWTLTINGGHSLTINSRFETFIPTPGGLALLGSAGLLGLRRRRH